MSSPIETNIRFHVKFTSAWQARFTYKCVPYSSHSYSSSGISVQTGASPLGLYYRYASSWKIAKVALQSEWLSLNLPCGSEDLMMSSQSLYTILVLHWLVIFTKSEKISLNFATCSHCPFKKFVLNCNLNCIDKNLFHEGSWEQQNFIMQEISATSV